MSYLFYACLHSLAEVQLYFELKSFDLSPGLGLPPSIQSHSLVCVPTQISDCYFSEESFFLLLIGFH